MMFKGILKEQTIQVGIGFVFIVVLLGTFILPEWMSNNFMYGLSRGLAVLGLMILWRTNLVSFGHALYYGFGAYAVAIAQKYLGVTDVFLRILIAIAAAGLLGFVLGFILRRYREIFKIIPIGNAKIFDISSINMDNKILIINGPNLEMLGKRKESVYGNFTLKDLENELLKESETLGCNLDFFQSNIEGEIINKINGLDESYVGIIINPGGLTHTSVSLHDSLEIKTIFKIEVHLSNIYSREDFRRKSLIAPACDCSIIGMGKDGFIYALRYLIKNI